MIDRLTDLEVVALTGYGEARGEPIDGLIAVMQVVGHRVRDPRYPSAWRAVCLQRQQFSCWNPGDPNRQLLERIAEALASKASLGSLRAPIVEALHVAEGVIASRYRDLVRKSCHYHATSVTPRWARGRTPVITIGHHRFYNDVP